MFNFIFDRFKVSEKDLTAKSLNRLRLFSTAILFAVPAFTVGAYSDASENISRILYPLLTIIVVGLLVLVGTNTITMTLSRTDKNLDEWEINLKRKAESFSYRFMMFIGLFFLICSVFLPDQHWQEFVQPNINMDSIYYFGLNLMVPFVILPIAYTAWTQKPLEQLPEN